MKLIQGNGFKRLITEVDVKCMLPMSKNVEDRRSEITIIRCKSDSYYDYAS